MDENPENNPQTNFELLWETVNNKYSFFELKGINWDSVYQHYAPMVDDNTTPEDLFTVLDSMLFDLRDGHVNLRSPFNVSRNWNWYLNYPDNFNYELVERNYLGNDHRIAGGLKYTIIDSVGYIYYGSFSSGFTNENLDQVMTYMKGTKGLIVDVRNNGGGFLGNAFALAQRLVQSKKEVLITFEKTGPGPDDFNNGLSYTLQPSEHVNYDGDVAILTNRRCYSATNFFAALLRFYDNTIQIGDQTGGGGGVPVDNELPNGWTYRFSATVAFIPVFDTALYNIELGVPPDVKLNNNPTRELQGIDDIIERGLNEFR